MNSDNIPENVQARIAWFLTEANKAIELYWKEMHFTYNTANKLMVESIGPKYIRIGVFEQHPALTGPYVCRSVYCFIDKAGNMLKAGGWKAPAKNPIRGSVLDNTALECSSFYGLVYLRGKTGGSSLATILAANP